MFEFSDKKKFDDAGNDAGLHGRRRLRRLQSDPAVNDHQPGADLMKPTSSMTSGKNKLERFPPGVFLHKSNLPAKLECFSPGGYFSTSLISWLTVKISGDMLQLSGKVVESKQN